MTVTVVILKICVLLFLITGMLFTVRTIRTFNPLEKLLGMVNELERDRLLEVGSQEKTFIEKYLDKLDEQLTQAGVKRLLPRAGVEIYFLFNVLEFTLIFFLMGEGILIPFLTAALAVYVNKLILDILRFRNKHITEKHLLELLNLFSDYSITESEITMILYRCGQTLPNPLKRALTQCHLSARSTGNTKLALYELRRSIDHFLFQEIILLLEICNKSGYGYQKVLTGGREMVNRYLKEQKEKAAVIRSLVGEAALMTGVAAYGIFTMLHEFAGDAGFGNSMIEFFFYNPAGQFALIIYASLIFAMIQVILKFAKR